MTNLNFNPNKSPIEVIKEGAFGGTYFRDIYSNANGKLYKNSWKEFNFLKHIDHKYYPSDFYDVKKSKCGVKCGTSLRFWKEKGGINAVDPYGWFQWDCRYYFGTQSSNDKRQIKRNNNAIVNRFKAILVKMIKYEGAKFDDYSISPKIRQILLHWGYELTKEDLA